jgi:PAS domain-containing protein
MGALYTEIYDSDIRGRLSNPEASFALSCWELARGVATLPTEEALLRMRLDWLMPDVMVLRRGPDSGLVYAHYGARIAEHAGFDMTGKALADFQGAIGDFYRECYDRVLASDAPLATVHRLGSYDERPIWERVILPVLQADGQRALFVVNRVRKLEDDIALLSSRARGNGVIALQFRRDPGGSIVDAVIAGANAAAQKMTGRRLDELLDKSIRDCFPGVIVHALWWRYLEVATTRVEQAFQIDYRMDGLDDLFDVRLYPFRDGVAIDFRILQRAGEGGASKDALVAA